MNAMQFLLLCSEVQAKRDEVKRAADDAVGPLAQDLTAPGTPAKPRLDVLRESVLSATEELLRHRSRGGGDPTLAKYRDRLIRAEVRYETARQVALEAEIPDSEVDPHMAPVTITGWYERTTLDGRPAWQYCHWHGGRLYSDPVTSSIAASKELAAAAEEHYEALRAYNLHAHARKGALA